MGGKWSKPALALLALVTVVNACGDQSSPLAPWPEAALGSADLAEPASATVTVLRRTGALAEDVTVARAIGIAGGTIEIPAAGVRVYFPRGAVPVAPGRTITISITALKGNAVAYEFQPHGLVFETSVHVFQDVRNTEVMRDPALMTDLYGAYFATRDRLDVAANRASVSEKRQAKPFGATRVHFPIEHFSGYVLASGR